MSVSVASKRPAYLDELDMAVAHLGDAYRACKPLVVAAPSNPLEVDLGDGNTFADLMGCGIAIVEQVDRETQQTHHVVLTRDNLERLLAALI